jgi:hypothetical protein
MNTKAGGSNRRLAAPCRERQQILSPPCEGSGPRAIAARSLPSFFPIGGDGSHARRRSQARSPLPRPVPLFPPPCEGGVRGGGPGANAARNLRSSVPIGGDRGHVGRQSRARSPLPRLVPPPPLPWRDEKLASSSPGQRLAQINFCCAPTTRLLCAGLLTPHERPTEGLIPSEFAPRAKMTIKTGPKRARKVLGRADRQGTETFGRASGGVGRPTPNKTPAGSGDPRRTKDLRSGLRRGRETHAEQNKSGMNAHERQDRLFISPPLPPPSQGGERSTDGWRRLASRNSAAFVRLSLWERAPEGRVRALRLAATTALIATMLLSGCSVSRTSNTTASSSPENAIERKAEKGPVKLFVRVTPREPRLSDLVDMEVTVESQPDVEIKPPAFGQAVGDFIVRDYTERPVESGAGNVRRFHYQLEPAHAGKHLIRSVSIEFVDKRPNSERRGEPVLIETDPLEVNVTSELGGEAPSLANLEPMVDPRPVPQTVAVGWLVGAALAVVLAIVAVIVFRRRKRRPIEPRRRTPEEIAQEALALLLVENLPARGLVKEFYLRLTGIVRQYVEDTTGIRAPEQTTEEFLRDMRSRNVFPRERSARLAEFLEAADLVKYAGQRPEEGQIDQAVARAHEFVNATPSPAAMAGASAD